MVKSWLYSARAVAVTGTLLLGASSTALADHPSIDVTISTPGIYTRFATGPFYGFYPYYVPGGYYAYAPPPSYVPGYWTHYPQRGYWRDDDRDYNRHGDSDYDRGYDRGPRHHDDRGRHEGWRHNKHDR